jgi:acetyltransferase-like isoleucine patch superfamily enzyme
LRKVRIGAGGVVAAGSTINKRMSDPDALSMQRHTHSIANRLIRPIKRLARKLRKRKAADAFALSDNGTVLAGYSLDVRAGLQTGRVKIGSNSVLSCRIILERDEGAVSIGDKTFIGNSVIICAEDIVIGDNVLISWGCTLVDHDSHALNWRERANDVEDWRQGLLLGGLHNAALQKNWAIVERSPIRIADKAWIGMNVTILKGVTIGEGAVVAAGSIVTKDVAPWTLVGGNPARLIRELPVT